jgi:hypothetical protein
VIGACAAECAPVVTRGDHPQPGGDGVERLELDAGGHGSDVVVLVRLVECVRVCEW